MCLDDPPAVLLIDLAEGRCVKTSECSGGTIVEAMDIDRLISGATVEAILAVRVAVAGTGGGIEKAGSSCGPFPEVRLLGITRPLIV